MGTLNRASRAVLVTLLVAGVAVTVVPVPASADFEDPGKNGAQVDVVPSDDLPDTAVVQVTGKKFAPNAAAQIYVCLRDDWAYAPFDCQIAGNAPTDASGGFSVPVTLSASFDRKIVTKCANAGRSECEIYVASDLLGSATPPPADAKHHICFAGTEPCNSSGTTTSSSSTSTTSTLPPTTTTTTPPPPREPCTLRELAVPPAAKTPPSSSAFGNKSGPTTDTAWRSVNPATSPPPREAAAMAFDASTGQTVLFGGFVRGTTGCVLRDTWVWDGTNWSQKSPQNRPSARYGHAMAYDGTDLVLFGGYDGASDLGDTWTWNGTDWVPRLGLASAPPARARTSIAYDEARDQTVLFGGYAGSTPLDDTWTWDGANQSWSRRQPVIKPGPRGFASMAFHEGSDRVVLQAGWTGNHLGDTWSWDGTTWMQEGDGNGPATRSGAMAHHPATGLLVYRSGTRSADFAAPPRPPGLGVGSRGATWDGRAWSALTQTGTTTEVPDQGPPLRLDPAMAEDALGQVVFFGGYGGLTAPLYEGELCNLHPSCAAVTGDNSDRGDTWTLSTPATAVRPSTDVHVDLRLDPSQVPANGESTVQATATVTLAGAALPGQTVRFSVEGDAQLAPTSGTTDVNGKVTITITASTTPGGETVRATTEAQAILRFNVATDVAVLVEEPLESLIHQVADFDGNASTDYSVFRPETGTWFVKDGLTAAWGAEGDIPVPADYDGDRSSDVAVFRPSNGVWFVKDGQTLAYGVDGDIPVPADYDGDDKADIAVFRPSNGVWYIHYSAGGDAAFGWGTTGDVAVPADYDGDGKADAAVFRGGVWYIRPASGTAHITVAYGTAGDIPVVADYDADRIADIAVFRPSGGMWFLRHSSDPTVTEEFAFGTDGDIPVPGDYNGDEIADAAVFRPSNGVWFVETGETVSWGIGTDIPLPIPASIRRSIT